MTQLPETRHLMGFPAPKRIDTRKIPADSVPYGRDISGGRNFAWAAYDADGTLVSVGATAPEARRKYREAKR